MSCLLYDIAIEPLVKSIRKSILKDFKIQGLEEKILVSLFADDMLVYMNENDNKKTLERIIENFYEVSTAKFNNQKSEILPMGTKEYRNNMIETRTVNKTTNDKIDQAIRIVKDNDSLRTLGAYIGNNSKTSIQWEEILKRQSKILKSWSKMSLSAKGKELIIKALIQSRALYLVTANEMPKSIAQRMTSQMKSFMWEGKRLLMNQMDVTQPRSNGGLDLLDIEARLEAIQITWLKKYLAPITKRPIWAFVTDQIVFKYTQKAPVVNDQNKINWVLQTWDITNTKEKKVPDYIKEMLKVGRKYNIGYNTIVAEKDQRQKIPIWHYIGVLDNHFITNGHLLFVMGALIL